MASAAAPVDASSVARSRDIKRELSTDAGADPASGCLARIWNNGLGGRCGKRTKGDSEFCGRHDSDQKRSMGRVDGPIPAAKVQEF